MARASVAKGANQPAPQAPASLHISNKPQRTQYFATKGCTCLDALRPQLVTGKAQVHAFKPLQAVPTRRLGCRQVRLKLISLLSCTRYFICSFPISRNKAVSCAALIASGVRQQQGARRRETTIWFSQETTNKLPIPILAKFCIKSTLVCLFSGTVRRF